jgi:hypothetical protein
MADHWGFVAAAYGLTAVVLLLYWRRLQKQEREVDALRRSTGERSRDASRTGHPRPDPASRPPLP